MGLVRIKIMKISNGMKKLIITLGALALPLTSFAAATGFTDLETVVQSLGRIVNMLIPIVFALGLLVFFWGLVTYIFGEHDKEKAKKTMLWGVVALFVMAAVWGLVRFIGDTFGVNPNAPAPTVGIPKVTGGN